MSGVDGRSGVSTAESIAIRGAACACAEDRSNDPRCICIRIAASLDDDDDDEEDGTRRSKAPSGLRGTEGGGRKE